MKFRLETLDIAKLTTDCAIIGIYEEGEWSPSAKKLNELSGGHLRTLLNYGEFNGKIGQTFLAYDVPKVSIPRILLVGCGKKAPLNARNYQKIVISSIKALSSEKKISAASFLTELDTAPLTLPWKIKQAVESTFNALYQFTPFKSEPPKPPGLYELTLQIIAKGAQHSACEVALKQALCIAHGVKYTKDLANVPSNICTPTYIATQAKKLAGQFKSLSIKVLDRAEMKKLGMNALLAVAQGSAQPPKLICMHYRGAAKKQAPVALVGKGITFDTGGISLKPAESMVGMKYDMCGAATVLGTLRAAAELKLPINLVGVMAVTENMPGGSAYKPEDIVTSLSGQTIEVLNTDAEGRVVLADALTYAEQFKPDVVIDIATLTGAVVVALGTHATGLLANDDALAKDLIDAGIESHDRAWQLPLWEEYQDQLKSPFADMSNVGGRAGGTITAACFLSRFAKNMRWAHLDVAGTAAMMLTGSERYATGRPVPLLMQYLINRCKKK